MIIVNFEIGDIVLRTEKESYYRETGDAHFFVNNIVRNSSGEIHIYAILHEKGQNSIITRTSDFGYLFLYDEIVPIHRNAYLLHLLKE